MSASKLAPLLQGASSATPRRRISATGNSAAHCEQADCGHLLEAEVWPTLGVVLPDAARCLAQEARRRDGSGLDRSSSVRGARIRLWSQVGKEKGFALSPIRAREMRRFLERNGYEVVPGQHKHLKLRHDAHGDVLLPLRPGDNLSYVAIKQIAAALGIQPEELIRQAR